MVKYQNHGKPMGGWIRSSWFLISWTWLDPLFSERQGIVRPLIRIGRFRVFVGREN